MRLSLNGRMPDWADRANRHPATASLDACLRGVGMVLFLDNPVTGLLILVGLLVASPWLCVATFVGCSPQLGVLEDHEARWSGKAPSSYQYTHAGTGMAPRLQTQVTVRDRVVAGGGQTVEQLFDDVRRRLGSSCDVTVTYEEQLGYPLSVYSDCGEEGDGWKVTDFAVLE